MEISETTIANDALLLLGGAKESMFIQDINDESDETAKLCARVYAESRDSVLVSVKPDYAMKFGSCTGKLSGVSLPQSADWTYVFNLPADCLDYYVAWQTDYWDRNARYDHFIFGKYLCTDTLSNENADGAYLFYLWALTNVKMMSRKLRSAISCEMAQRLAGPLAPEMMEYVRSRAQMALSAAIMQDAYMNRFNGVEERKDEDFEWLSTRFL